MKLGENVIIKTDLKHGKWYGDAIWLNTMNEFLGKEMVITKILEEGEYELNNITKWTFTDEMFDR